MPFATEEERNVDKPSLASQPSTRSRLTADDKSSVVRNSLLAGSCSGMASTLILYPLDVIRTKMQSTSTGGGPLQTLRHTVAHGGIRALYTGMFLPLAAQAVYKGSIFSVNSYVQQWIIDYRTTQNRKRGWKEQAGQLTGWDRFVCGFVGGAVNAAFFVTPVEFVRNQLIAQHTRAAAGEHVATLSSWQVIQRSVSLGGLPSLWRGISWSIARDGIGCGCFFAAMAWCQKRLTVGNEPPSFPVAVFSGGMAGLAFWIVALPLDTVKTWVQSADVTTAKSPLAVQASIREIYHNNGVTGIVQRLNRGWQVAYGRGIPSAAITISVYSTIYGLLEGQAPV